MVVQEIIMKIDTRMGRMLKLAERLHDNKTLDNETIKRIRSLSEQGLSEADYNIALKRIETLFHAVPNTPEGDELEALISFVNAYEDLNYQM